MPALPTVLRVLPVVRKSAVANMVDDLLLLESAEREQCLYLRHYAWESRCFTFGYTQSLSWVREQVPTENRLLLRRPTAGGIVDHFHDFTYSLVVPATHPAFRTRACDLYREVHEAILDALKPLNCAAGLQPCVDVSAKATAPSVCFREPVVHDLVKLDGGAKIAGAAQKRTRMGLLMQGSIDRMLAPPVENSLFWTAFVTALANRFTCKGCQAEFPEFSATRSRELHEMLKSEAWQHKRR